MHLNPNNNSRGVLRRLVLMQRMMPQHRLIVALQPRHGQSEILYGGCVRAVCEGVLLCAGTTGREGRCGGEHVGGGGGWGGAPSLEDDVAQGDGPRSAAPPPDGADRSRGGRSPPGGGFPAAEDPGGLRERRPVSSSYPTAPIPHTRGQEKVPMSICRCRS